MADTQSQPEHLSSARLFVGDAVFAVRLLNEARHRIVSRVFGTRREHSNLMTLFVIGAFVRGLQRAAAAPGTQVRKARSSPTAVGDTMLGVAAAKETVNSMAGHPARDTPLAAGLIALAVTLYAFRASHRRLRHALKPAVHRIAAAARRARAVMGSWGISASYVRVSPAPNSHAVGEDGAH